MKSQKLIEKKASLSIQKKKKTKEKIIYSIKEIIDRQATTTT